MDLISNTMDQKAMRKKYDDLVSSIESANMYDGRGEYNGYVCEKCGYITATLYKDAACTVADQSFDFPAGCGVIEDRCHQSRVDLTFKA